MKENTKCFPIIHVGYPKTATTWFREKFYPNIRNYYYVSRNDVAEKILDINVFNFEPLKTRLFFLQKYGERIVICEERILVDLQKKGFLIKENANRLKSVFPEAKVVILIRNQLELFASKYSQYIKAGGNYGIRRYLFREKKDTYRMEEFFSNYSYDKIIDYYFYLFGENNVFVYLYEDFAGNPHKIINSIVSEFEFDVDSNLETKSVNTRLRWSLLYLLRFINCFTRKRRINKYYLIHIPYLFEVSRVAFLYLNKFRIFGKPISTKKLLGKKNSRFIINFYKKSNRLLIEKYGLVKIKDYGYPL